MRHHGNHSTSSQFRSDVTNVCLTLLFVLNAKIGSMFANHAVNLQIECGQQAFYHLPEILARKVNGDVTAGLLPIGGEQLLLNLTGLFWREEVVARHHHSLGVWVFELSCQDLINEDEASNQMAHLAKRGEISESAKEARFFGLPSALACPRCAFNLCSITNGNLWSCHLPTGDQRNHGRCEHLIDSGSCQS